MKTMMEKREGFVGRRWGGEDIVKISACTVCEENFWVGWRDGVERGLWIVDCRFEEKMGRNMDGKGWV